MRLTQIKLSGFKSFVDPTTIAVPGQLVGIVGPNGCGKSNVIDAVRWVLGESSARQLRGETMQDVIFNGSGNRQPAARSSVELVFDNSMGKAAGQWSTYSEIAIRRVLTREGNSDYFINNIGVRRRDISDLFLGTGVGARAYGIIEQGMISRIIEAKPEELRVFLEEAAGVSKYRERRRETELRLADTRENLQRVEDIRQELGERIGHLTGQAEVAARYRDLQQQLASTQNALWLMRRQEAQAARARHARDIERATVELESETTRLREAERDAEGLRAGYYAASDAVNAAQGDFYQAGHEVARLEQQVQFLRENRARIESQITSFDDQIADAESRRAQGHRDRTYWEGAAAEAQGQLERLMVRVAAESERLPQAQESFRAAQMRLDEVRRSLAQTEQAAQVEATRCAHSERVLQQLDGRSARLADERAALTPPDTELIADLRASLERAEALLGARRGELAEAEHALPLHEQALRDAVRAVDEIGKRITGLEARRAALSQVQARIGRNQNVDEWLAQHGLDARPRFWQGIRIADGWEDALEAVLRERLNAVALDAFDGGATGWLDATPPAKLAVFEAADVPADEAVASAGLDPLSTRVTCTDPRMAAALAEWLAGVHVVPDRAAGLARRHLLPPGGVLVSPEGHVFTRHSVSFHAPDGELHGVLSRQREIESLGAGIERETGVIAEARAVVAGAEEALEAHKAGIARLRTEVATAQQEQHRLQLEVLRLTEQAQRIAARGEQIDAELAEIAAERTHEEESLAVARFNVEEHAARREELEQALAAALEHHRSSEAALSDQRNALAAAEKESQEAVFQQKTCVSRTTELGNLIASIEKQLEGMRASLEKLQEEHAGLDESGPAEALQQALAVRAAREQELARARDALADAENTLRETEAKRADAEAKIDPLRSRVGDLKLKEQEARLTEEQFGRQLFEAGADEEAVAATLDKSRRPAALQSDIASINEQITALGAVNLAALDELATATERKNYLDTQSVDLTEALETLESAIRRIDRETRELLQTTFDEVNRHFGELFPTLFGGGEAKLVLTGEEILDSGVQVVARPPGKKNQSIHLLSGGEKALTALSLVFSMFQLNPAPFCLLDEVDAPLDDSNTERFCQLVRRMAQNTQFLYISHNKITMEIAEQLIGVTMQELGVSRVVAVDIEEAMKLAEEKAA